MVIHRLDISNLCDCLIDHTYLYAININYFLFYQCISHTLKKKEDTIF